MALALGVSAAALLLIAAVLGCSAAFGSAAQEAERWAVSRLDSLTTAWLSRARAVLWPLLPAMLADKRFHEAFSKLTLTQVFQKGFSFANGLPLRPFFDLREVPDDKVQPYVCRLSAMFLVGSLLSAVLFFFGLKVFGLWMLVTWGASWAGFLISVPILGLLGRWWARTGSKWLSLLLVPVLVLVGLIYNVSGLLFWFVFSWPAAGWTAFFATSRLAVMGVGRVAAWLHSFGGLFTPLLAGAFGVAGALLGLWLVLISYD